MGCLIFVILMANEAQQGPMALWFHEDFQCKNEINDVKSTLELHAWKQFLKEIKRGKKPRKCKVFYFGFYGCNKGIGKCMLWRMQ